MPEARRIEGHHDFGVLERRLVELIRQAKEAGPFAPVAIIAPTQRLLAHLQGLLAGAFPSLVQTHFLTHDSLARAAAGAAGAPCPWPLPDVVRDEVLRLAIAAQGGPLADYVETRPGSVAALRATLDDLREAGVSPAEALTIVGVSQEAKEILRLDVAYTASLESLAPAGLSDRAGSIRASLPHVRAFARGFRLILHYGAYELIGANLALVEEMEASGAPVIHLVPFHATSPAYGYTRRFWQDALGATPVAPPSGDAGDRLLAARLPLLYDETARPAAIEPGERIAFFHAQGNEAELKEVALRILALHRDEGIPLTRMGVVARTLEPYAPCLARVFGAHGLPFTTTAVLPATREALVQAALDLARLVLGDFERQPLLDLCRSGLLRLEGLDPWREAHGWDRLGRDFRVASGLTAWTSLPGWVERWEPEAPRDAEAEVIERLQSFKAARLGQARALAAAVETLQRVSRPLRAAGSWRAWAERIEELCRRLLSPPDPVAGDGLDDAGAEALHEVFTAAHDLEASGVPFSTAAALAFVERALGRASLRVDSGRDDGGVRILDAMQARGLAFDALFLLGQNADLAPRRPREDPFLPDADRSILRGRLAPSLPIKTAAREEERLLLALQLGGARRRLTISWQRADEDGRARVPSLALREIARVVLGAPDMHEALLAARRVAAHPREAGLDAVGRSGLLPPAEACLNVALELGSPALMLQAVPRLPLPQISKGPGWLEAGLSMLKVIEDPDAGDLRFDACVGDALPAPRLWSPSRLEVLGNCPQYYFFRHVLRVEEMREPVDGFDIEAQEIGAIVHEVLRDVYVGLAGAGDRGGLSTDPAGTARRAQEIAAEAWPRRAAGLGARMKPRYPLLWEATSSLWLGALCRFLSEDLAVLAAAGARVVATEEEGRTMLDLGPAGPIEIRGRFDRIVRRGDGGLVVGDYKSSGRIDRQVSPAEALKGTRLQIPLYVLMAESLRSRWSAADATVTAEVLGVGPGFGEPEDRAGLDPEQFSRHREAFQETLSVLVDLAAAGRFPLNRHSGFCRSCPYVRACRRTHPPTLERLAADPDGMPFALLRSKSTRAATLAAVRAASAGPEDP